MSDAARAEIDRLRKDLHEALRNRARLTYYFLAELREHMEEARAVEILRRGAARIGVETAQKIRSAQAGRELGPMELVDLYSRMSPDQGRVYPLRTTCAPDGACRLETLACPAKTEMEALGVSQHDFEQVVAILDGGTVALAEGLGLCVRTTFPRLHGPVCCIVELSGRSAPGEVKSPA